MVIIILASIPVVMLGALLYNSHLATKERLNTILGVALPVEEFKNPKVLGIINDFKKSNYKWTVILAILLLPILLINYSSIALIYLMGWFGVSYLIYRRKIVNSNKALRELKSEMGWLVHQRRSLSIDTYVSAQNNLMPISKLWFIPSILVSIMTIILGFYFKDSLGTLGFLLVFTAILTTIILIGMYVHYSNKPNEIYTDNSNINLIYNKSFKRAWTFGTVIGATIQSLIGLISLLIVQREFVNELIVLLFLLPMVTFVLGIVLIQRRVNELQGEVLKTVGNEIYTDSDDCWKKGYYYNPDDSRHSIQDRFTDNTTYNLATKKGKAIVYGNFLFAAITLVVVFTPLLMFDFIGHKLIVSNDIVEIKAPFYGTTLDKNDIKSVELVDDIKVKARTNGYGGNTYSLGNFSLTDGTSTKLYLYTDNKPYIKIITKDKNIYLNGINKEETEKYYNQIKE